MEREFEWGYREPGIGDVGEKVEVGPSWRKRILAAVLPEDMRDRFVCRSAEDFKDAQCWRSARIRYRLPYGERQAKCGIGVGDFVKVLRVPENHEDDWGTHAVSSMAASVGKVFEVDEVHGRAGVLLKDGHWYPYFVVERVEKPVVEDPKPKIRRVSDLADGEVICTNDGDWIQVVPCRDGVYCDIESANGNPFQEGWIKLRSKCAPGNRLARLLCPPVYGVESYGKTVFAVDSPSDRWSIRLLFSDGAVSRAVVCRDGDYRVFLLSDLRVIPE